MKYHVRGIARESTTEWGVELAADSRLFIFHTRDRVNETVLRMKRRRSVFRALVRDIENSKNYKNSEKKKYK